MIKPKIIVAGIGNLFCGDDGFGPEVVRILSAKPQPENVSIRVFGSGGVTLASELAHGFDALIVVDAIRRGGKPGTLYSIEPTSDEITSKHERYAARDPYNPNVFSVLFMVEALHDWPLKTIVVGCEPSRVSVSGEFEAGVLAMGLSAAVRAALPEAVQRVEDIIARLNTEVTPS